MAKPKPLDRELKRVAEYRGFSIVFSGGKSLHFHFVFSTRHILGLPFGASAAERRQEFREASAVLHNAHNRYWDHAHDAFVRVLTPSIAADRKLRSLTQWRRVPWGIRLLDEGSILGFLAGTRITQLVIRERLFQRAPKGNFGFLVPQAFSSANPVKGINRRHEDRNIGDFDASPMLALLQEVCSGEWGEWPKPVEVSIQDGSSGSAISRPTETPQPLFSVITADFNSTGNTSSV
jgi:hypothetical protein